MPRTALSLTLGLVMLLPGAARAQEPAELRSGDVATGEVGGGERRAHAVRLAAGDYLRATVEPAGVDVALALKGPDGASVILVDLRPDPKGPETLHVVASAAGLYRLEVVSSEKSSKPAGYTLRIDAVRAPT